MFWKRENVRKQGEGEAERLTQSGIRAIDSIIGERGVDWAMLSKIKVIGKKEREESREESGTISSQTDKLA